MCLQEFAKFTINDYTAASFTCFFIPIFFYLITLIKDNYYNKINDNLCDAAEESEEVIYMRVTKIA